MATGATLASLPLPAYSISGASSVSLSSPPAVPLVAGGLVLVTPPFQENNVVEAFAGPAPS
jgi:hypothetical protein